jgi:RimJ/RimL family protein N-acetyltransferase
MLHAPRAPKRRHNASVDDAFDRLLTDRLVIRRFGPADAMPFARYRSLPEVARYQSWEAPYSVDRANAFIEWMTTHHPDEPGEWYQLAIATREDPATLIGDCAFQARASEPSIVDIGYTLSPAGQGQGFATEAVSELLRYLFEDRAKHKVCADCDTRNDGSWRLLERLGFTREGELRAAYREHDGWSNEYLYGLLAEEWRERSTVGGNPSNRTGSTT